MHCPHLQAVKQYSKTQDLFFGLNHNLRLGSGECYDMKNLTSDLTPVLCPRAPRGIVSEGKAIGGLLDREGLCTVEGEDLLLNGYAWHLKLSTNPKDCPKQLVSMGAYVIILPDKKYVNTADPQDFGNIEAETTTAGPVTLTQCSLDGSEIKPSYIASETPKDPLDRVYWLDTGEKKLKQYAEATGLWVTLETPFVKLTCPGIGRQFAAYDGVEISGLPPNALYDLNGGAALYGCGEDFILWPGLIEKPMTLETPVTVARKMPKMDFLTESGNRLWGCRYGLSDRGEAVNELYSCKLGDFKNWSCYLGISTDSYRVSLGSDGPFTGAITQGGHPLFFKENCLHKVFGQFPSNFQVQTTACRGVEKGSDKSLALVGDVLYFKSPDGICAYDGSLPREVSQALGKVSYGKAVGAALGNKYYVSMEKEGGTWELLVYDTARNLWHKEDDLHAVLLCRSREDLYCFDSQGRLLTLLGSEGTREERVPWMVQSGMIGIYEPGNRYLHKLLLRLQLEPGSELTVLINYDSGAQWENVGTVRGMGLQSFTLPVLPRRCDHFSVRLQGKGRAKLFAVTRVFSPGGSL